jgi:hypothetical protein
MLPNLSRFEDHIQRLVEGGFARLFAGRLHPHEVAVALARAMEDHLRQENHERRGPDVYTVRLNPADHGAILEAEPDITETLAAELVDLARAGGISLTRVPQVHLLADEEVPVHQIAVAARHSQSGHDTTQAMPLNEMQQGITQGAPRATLILDDKREISLTHPIINIGRQHDNDIILDDSGISRHHIQIRLRFGQFVVFDLGSTAGTLVNGQRIQEHVLQSGDVIRLSNFVLIYVEEEPTPTEESDQPLADTQAQEPLDL